MVLNDGNLTRKRLFNKYLLILCLVQNTILDNENATEDYKGSCSCTAYILVGRKRDTDDKQVCKCVANLVAIMHEGKPSKCALRLAV